MILKLALQFALQVDLENRVSERELTKAVKSLENCGMFLNRRKKQIEAGFISTWAFASDLRLALHGAA